MPSPKHRAKVPSTSGRLGVKPTSRRAEVKISDPLPFSFSHQTLTAEEQKILLDGPMPERIDPAWPRKTTPIVVDNWMGDNIHDLDIPGNRFSSVAMSSMRSMPSKSSLDQNQDRSSGNGFKATIKRMFGSKRHRPSMPDMHKDNHKSDPGNLTATSDLRADLSSSQGSPRPRSAPRETVAKVRSKPGSVDAPMLGAPFAERMTGTYKRRNTLPSLALSDQEQQNFSKSLKNLLGVDIEHSAQDDRPLPKNENRRSKSAGALATTYLLDQARDFERQDRNSKVARWRDGAMTAAVPPPTISISTLPTSDPELEREYIREVPSLEQIIKPAQSFDFGLESSANQASDLEDRVNTLEVKMFDFEYAIARLQGVEISKPVLPTKKTRRKSVHEVFSQPSMQSLTTSSSACDRTLPSPGGSPIIRPGLQEPFQIDRTSKTTIRPLRESKSHVDLAGDRTSYHLSPSQFDALIAMIQDEKAARQQMEMHILDLQREVDLLQTPVYAVINDTLPSPDSVKTVPLSQKRLHRSPPFKMSRPLEHETSRFSMTESETDSVDEGLAEPFVTPRRARQNLKPRKGTPLAGTVS